MIRDPELVARLQLSDRAFEDYVLSFTAQLGPRAYTAQTLEHALGYPWTRPARSYLLGDDAVTLIDALDAGRRAELLERFTGAAAGRMPLLAIGSNGSPDVLRRKFAHFAAPEDRDVLVITGHLHGFDVGASAHVALYGAMPATLFPSPGTAARTAILWLTEPQFTQLVWTELSYSLGRLATRFEADEPGFDVAEVLAFVSRFGAFAPEGAPVALAAIPARRRAARALSQRELLRRAGELAFGPEASPARLVRAIHEDYAGTVPRVLRTVRPRGEPFHSPHWTPVIAPTG